MSSPNSPIFEILLERFEEAGDAPALAYRDEIVSFGELKRRLVDVTTTLDQAGIKQGDTVILAADYSPHTVLVFLALIKLQAIIVPTLPRSLERNRKLLAQADPAHLLSIDDLQQLELQPWGSKREVLPLITELRRRRSSGLILFTSGSTGEPKAVVHDFGLLLEKFRVRRPAMVTLNFLLFDHWGGLNTLLHGLSNQSLIVLPEQRTPNYICELIERHKVQLLPTAPTFLNMMLISHAWKDRDFSALRVISYGAEPMPNSTLTELNRLFPKIELRQTYGLIELGVLRAKSRDSDSLWVKLGGDGYDLRVVDDILQIKASSAMLGYLNAPSPITDDGYFITGDQVEVDGDYFRILGRASDLINVGGEKVFPAEVEAVLLSCDNIRDAVVFGEKHPMLGNIVCADVILIDEEDDRDVRIRLKRECKKHLDGFKVPVKINCVTDGIYSDRMKKLRLR